MAEKKPWKRGIAFFGTNPNYHKYYGRCRIVLKVGDDLMHDGTFLRRATIEVGTCTGTPREYRPQTVIYHGISDELTTDFLSNLGVALVQEVTPGNITTLLSCVYEEVSFVSEWRDQLRPRRPTVHIAEAGIGPVLVTNIGTEDHWWELLPGDWDVIQSGELPEDLGAHAMT